MRALHPRARHGRGAALKRVALGLLVAACLLDLLALRMAGAHPAWGYVGAFAEAAMIGAIADWFAVVALFRHPLGLPFPHTAIIPANKDRIGERLAGFFVDNFLGTAQVLQRLREAEPAGRIARWLSQPERAGRLAGHLSGLVAYALAAFDDARVRDFLARATATGLRRVDLAGLAGRLLAAMTAEDRHQPLVDEAVRRLAAAIEEDSVQEQVAEAIAREVRALRYVGLDQVAARLAARRVVSVAARTLADMAADPQHELRLRLDAGLRRWIERLQTDPAWRERAHALREQLLAHPALAQDVHALWQELSGWLQADLARPESALRRRVAEWTTGLGERLAADAGMRQWLDEQLLEAAPRAIDRYRGDIRRYIAERMAAWDAADLTRELERHIGRDLQFIRINGTLVGGGVGLLIHALRDLAS